MKKKLNQQRKGTMAVLVAFLLVPLIALIAFAVDYGFLLYIKANLQRVADQAVLAAVQDLVPNSNGIQDLTTARNTVIEYVQRNLGDDFDVNQSDIEIGKFNPDTIYSSVEIFSPTSGSSGNGNGNGRGNGRGNGNSASDESVLADTVRVSLRRDSLANKSVSLYFARIFGREEADVSVTSTAILQRARFITPGTELLPIAISEEAWDNLQSGDEASVYGDRITDNNGNNVSGNFGTVNIGPASNSTRELRDQIDNGLSENDLQSLHNQGVIQSPNFIDSQIPLTVQADPGLSAGIRRSIEAAESSIRLIPIIESFSGKGGNAEARIVRWGVVEVGDSQFKGSNNTFVNIKRVFGYNSLLSANPDLSDTSDVIEGAYTSPALVE